MYCSEPEVFYANFWKLKPDTFVKISLLDIITQTGSKKTDTSLRKKNRKTIYIPVS
jgi:hypothetical protein